MTTTLDVLAQVNIDLGWPTQRRTSAAEYPCPVHRIPLVVDQLSTFDGWLQLTSCPAFDGTCSYDPTGPAQRIEPPQEDTTADSDEPTSAGS